MKTECPRARKDIIISKLGAETMLYDPKTDQLHILNPTASLVWSMADGRHDLKKMAENIRRLFKVFPETPVDSDLSRLLSTWRQKGLLEDKFLNRDLPSAHKHK